MRKLKSALHSSSVLNYFCRWFSTNKRIIKITVHIPFIVMSRNKISVLRYMLAIPVLRSGDIKFLEKSSDHPSSFLFIIVLVYTIFPGQLLIMS